MYYRNGLLFIPPPPLPGDWVGDVPGKVQECSQINQRKDTTATIWKGAEDHSVCMYMYHEPLGYNLPAQHIPPHIHYQLFLACSLHGIFNHQTVEHPLIISLHNCNSSCCWDNYGSGCESMSIPWCIKVLWNLSLT